MATVTTERRGSTAILFLDNPPVNMGNTRQRAAVVTALRDIAADAEVRSVVIASKLPHFYAGSDLKEFGAELPAPELPEVIETIEGLDVPVVAAITGLALGGGLEFVLGCDGRIGDPTAQVGFPEVSLGMLPGAGGTVRTPRLTGTALAVDLVATGRRLDAQEALDAGILDEVVPADQLVERAVAVASSMTGKHRVIDLPIPHESPDEISAAVEKASRRARPNAVEAIELVQDAAGEPRAALAAERAAFHRLRLSDEAGNLCHLFFARRAAAKALRSAAQPRKVATVAIAGAGTMGASLAQLFTERGFAVIVHDRNAEALARLASRVAGVTTAGDVTGLADADLVIDAVFEDMGVKTELLRSLETVVGEETIIASNTSYLDLDEMSAVLDHPSRFAGLHFFNPPHRNPLVELITTAKTDDVTVSTLAALIGRLDKSGIPAGIGDGFVANRVYSDYRTQAEFLVEEGASPADVDRAMRGLGLPIGPFAVADMSGLDIAWARRKRLAPNRDPRQRYVSIPDRLCEAGRLGQKTSAGWYVYPDDARRGQPDPVVDEIISAERAAKGIEPRSVDDQEITDRILASMLSGAALLVESGIAGRAADIDVAMTEGFAFPKWLGGPVRALASRPAAEVLAALAAVHASCPITFAVAEPATRGELPAAVKRCLDEVRRPG